MANSSLVYNSRIVAVSFGINGTNTILKESNVPIKSYDLFKNGDPYENGMYDAHLGTTDHSYICQTCSGTKKTCLGHDGDLRLNYPVLNPMAFGELRKWLRLICRHCGHSVVPKAEYMVFNPRTRLNEASDLAKTGSRKCPSCNTPHIVIKKDPQEPLALLAIVKEEGVEKHKEVLYPHKIKQILDKISDQTVEDLGKNPREAHPRNFVLTAIKVPATTIRPDVKKMGGGRSTNDDITTILQIIAKKNDMIPPVLPHDIDPKTAKMLYELNNSYYEMVRGGGEGMVGLAQRLKGKQGRGRKFQLGKRVFKMMRTTITGNSDLPPGHVAIPMKFARNIQMEEIVQEFNKKRLMTYINNGRKRYPGCTKIVKVTGAEYGVESLGNIELENGDKVYRDMVTGDCFGYNRQPSLMASNITTVKAVVCADPEILTFQMNVLDTPFYNADFDGD